MTKSTEAYQNSAENPMINPVVYIVFFSCILLRFLPNQWLSKVNNNLFHLSLFLL